jgi:molybdate transport system regulatory protein
MKAKSTRILTIQPRLRVRVGQEVALGPGKVELLELVRQTGSITEAAKRMKMSYMRAWNLIQTLNQCFKEALVLTSRGGNHGGGAEITQAGASRYCAIRKWSATACGSGKARGKS